MTNHRGVKLCKAKGQYTEDRTDVTYLICRSLHTILHFPVLLGFLVDMHCRCCDSDCFQLGLSLWPRELDKPLWLSSLLFITDLNTTLLVERSLTAAISYISSVMLECWQNLSKLTNQRVCQIPVYRNDLLLSFPTGILLLPFATLFFIFRLLFSALRLTNLTPGRGYVM